MQTIKSVDVMSCAKVMGILYGVLGIFIVPVMLLGGLASMASGQREAAIPGVVFIVIGILAPFLYGGMGFVMGALGAWIYNVIAKRIGGIQIELYPHLSGAGAPGQFGV